MADLPLPVTAAPAVGSVTPVTIADELTAINVAIDNLPEKFLDLSRQVQVSGQITATSGDSFTLQTVAGDLTLTLPPVANGAANPLAAALPALLQSQQTLTVVLTPGEPQPVATLLINQTAPTAKPTEAGETAQPIASHGVKPEASLAVGQKLSAVVLPDAVGKNFESINAKNLDATGLLKPFASEASGILNPVKDIVVQSATAQSTNANENMAAKAIVSTTAVPVLKPGAQLDFKIAAIGLPDTTAPLADMPDKVVATVIGKGANGQLVLNANGTTLFIRGSHSDMPVGSRLLLEPVASTIDMVNLPDNPESTARALQQFMAALAQADPQMAQQVLQSRIPQPNAALPGTFLFLFNAMQQAGGVTGWLGEAADRLEKAGKHETIVKLIEEMQRGSGEVYDNAVGSWRSYPVPLHHQQMFEMLRLYVHQDGGRQGNDTRQGVAEKRTRFLINLSMTKLGSIQMDGFTHRKQLDMVIRSERALPPTLPRELRGMYVATLEAVGLTGSLNFQTGRQGWMVVDKAARNAGITT